MTRRASNPFDDIEEFFDRMSRQIDETGWSVGGDRVPVDLVDVGEEYVLRADLPGFDRDAIDLTVADGSLRIRAEADETDETITEEDDHRVIRRERQHRSVNRSVRIPEEVDAEGVTARYTNGVIEVTLPKSGVEDAKRIEIE